MKSHLSTPFPQPVQEALASFPLVFADHVPYTSSLGAAWAPGRVNLIGEHTDYNDGFVLPIAVDRVAAFAGCTRDDGLVRLWSIHFQEHVQWSLTGLPDTFEQLRSVLPRWACYILGVMAELARVGAMLSGFDAVVGGDVPLGGGMSSSAALEVATAQACALFSQERLSIGTSATPGASTTLLEPIQAAALCQRAEQIASGVQCGILDQAASCLGRPGQALLLDCRSLAYRYLPFEAPELTLVVIDTGVRRELATSAYNERRKQCEEAAQLLRAMIIQNEPENEAAQTIRALRDITLDQFAHYGPRLPELLRRRAGYIIAEDARVLQAVELLEKGRVESIGQLLSIAHIGLRDDYEVSCEELNALVEIAQSVPGVLGARMLGGGFGGCTITLVRRESLDVLRQAVEGQYPVWTGRQASIDVCRAAGGPGSAWVSES